MPDKHDVYLKVLMLPVSFGKTLSFKKITKGSPGTRGGRPGLAFKVLRLTVASGNTAAAVIPASSLRRKSPRRRPWAHGRIWRQTAPSRP